jgi:hypothetical protein
VLGCFKLLFHIFWTFLHDLKAITSALTAGHFELWLPLVYHLVVNRDIVTRNHDPTETAFQCGNYVELQSFS